MKVLVAVATRHRTTREMDWPSIRAWGREIGTSLAHAERSVS